MLIYYVRLNDDKESTCPTGEKPPGNAYGIEPALATQVNANNIVFASHQWCPSNPPAVGLVCAVPMTMLTFRYEAYDEVKVKAEGVRPRIQT